MMPELPIGNFETGWNNTLSDLDRSHAAAMYPWKPKSIVTVKNPTAQAISFQYKWSRDSEWRDSTLAANGQFTIWRSPATNGAFPSFDFRSGGQTSNHPANRMNPDAWKGRNYPQAVDGRQYRLQKQGNVVKLVAD